MLSIKKLQRVYFVLLTAAFPNSLWAVAVPDELLNKGGAGPGGTLYGFISIVFVAGIAIGMWVQKKMNKQGN